MEALPCKVELFRRRIVSDPLCDICGIESDSLPHIFFHCHGVRQVWEHLPISLPTSDMNPSVWSWVSRLARELSVEQFHLAAVVLWSIWDRRNKLLHGDGYRAFGEIVGWSSTYMESYRGARLSRSIVDKRSHAILWSPPPIGVIKINVDAAFPQGNDHYYTSMVARDSQGQSVWWQNFRHLGRVLPAEGEARAVLQATIMALSLGWPDIIIEGDCLPVIDALNGRGSSLTSFGAIIEAVLARTCLFSSISFSFVRCDANKLAHEIASREYLDSLEGVTLPPFLAMSA
ncbi:PREDICTED: uncharacterized protein LOC105952259 [Erythranthe guttata]|uniref:uncharacterized protein LOC105952259 n=1 Tax=Erythranthe guttata TaxID=4155 RepID=UPI00064DA6C7|nr:PREDICTED: uncharacterized protein LOC105952259 [Erythranthe guttata]|eukprot:XP_012831247.1 PREDICTED: uncharacterized protein LOC105952259 [Erythranthe guttata]